MSDKKVKTNLDLNKSKSWENIREKRPRQAKKLVNYKESRTYNKAAKIINSGDTDFSKKSSQTPRTSSQVQTAAVPSTSSFHDGNVTESDQISSQSTQNSENTILNRESNETGDYSDRES